MRIRIVESGGLAGLRRERVVETARLPAAERDALERLVEACGFFALPARPSAGAPRPMPDARQLDIEIADDQGRSHCVRVAELDVPHALRALLERALAARREEE